MSDLIDETGNLHTGTIVGSPTFSPGAVGLGIVMDGLTDYVEIPDSVDLNLATFTYMLWFNTSTTGVTQALIGNKGKIVNSNGTFLYQDSNNVLHLQFGEDNQPSANLNIVTPLSYADGNWHHVAVTYDGLKVIIYVNGVNVVEANYSGTIAYNGCAMLIGAYSNDDGVTPLGLWTGSFDDVRIHNQALSASEIHEIVHANPNSFEEQVFLSNPDWNWKLDAASGLVAADRMGNGDLEYESDASTEGYSVAASQADGIGFAKSMIGNEPPTDMVAHWQMNNEGGGQATIVDSTANGYDVPVSGSPTVGGVAGKIDEATYFNGSQVGILISHVPFDVEFISISAWIITTDAGIQCIYSNFSNDATAVSGVDFKINAGIGELTIGFNTGKVVGTDYAIASGATIINDGQWHHLIGTYDGLNIKLYTDGVLEGIKPLVGSISYDLPDARMNIACRTDDLYFDRINFLTGTLDEIRFYDRAITDQEAFNIYNEQAAVGPTALQIYDPVVFDPVATSNWVLDDYNATTVALDSQSGYDLTYVTASNAYSQPSSRHNDAGVSKIFPQQKMIDGAASGFRYAGELSTNPDFVIEFALMPNILPVTYDDYIMGKWYHSGDTGAWRLYLTTNYEIKFTIVQSDDTIRDIVLCDIRDAGAYYHAEEDPNYFTFWLFSLRMNYTNGATLELYVNDVIASSTDISSWSGSWKSRTDIPFAIGRVSDAYTNKDLTGRMDEVNIYNERPNAAFSTEFYNLWRYSILDASTIAEAFVLDGAHLAVMVDETSGTVATELLVAENLTSSSDATGQNVAGNGRMFSSDANRIYKESGTSGNYAYEWLAKGLTIECCFSWSGSGTANPLLMGKQEGNNSAHTWGLYYLASNNVLYLRMKQENGTYRAVVVLNTTDMDLYEDGVWRWMSISLDPITARVNVKIDDSEIKDIAVPTWSLDWQRDTFGRMAIGGYHDGFAWRGGVGRVGLYQFALTGAKRTEHYNWWKYGQKDAP